MSSVFCILLRVNRMSECRVSLVFYCVYVGCPNVECPCILPCVCRVLKCRLSFVFYCVYVGCLNVECPCILVRVYRMSKCRVSWVFYCVCVGCPNIECVLYSSVAHRQSDLCRCSNITCTLQLRSYECCGYILTPTQL